jgi:two-component system response regulator
MENYSHVEILLIEDSMEDAELTKLALKKHKLGNNLVHLEDGAQALDFIFARGNFADRSIFDIPKVILLDLNMPKIGGLEVIRQVKADERTKSIPIVVMTSSKEDQDIIESYKHGVNGYVVKPVGFEEFAKAVADLGMYWLLVNQSPRNV